MIVNFICYNKHARKVHRLLKSKARGRIVLPYVKAFKSANTFE